MADKGRERQYLERFKALCSSFPSGDIDDRSESPDFLISTADGIVGIELTVYHHPPEPGKRPHQEQHNLRQRIVSLAQSEYLEEGGSALYVTVFFREPTSLRKRDIDRLASQLECAVRTSPLPVAFGEPTVRIEYNHLPKEIAAVDVHASVNGRDQLWYAARGGWVAPIRPDNVRAEIRRKSAMVPTARAKCKDLWLVIVNNVFSEAAPAEFTAEAAESRFEHPFDRLFWFESHGRRVFELARQTETWKGT